jgi:ribosomal protein S12 methylthiotransferase
MRGLLVSRPIDEVLREGEKLARAGVREILVISQDTSAYGVDIRYRPAEWRGQSYETRFLDLARGLGELGIWIRMHYVYPYPHVDDVIPLMAERKVLPYLDIPFQHGSPTVLKRMKRPGMVEKTLGRIKAWREVCPDLTIRSTFIVGFPGETEAEFEELLAWLDEAQLDRVGAFKYSPVEGAPANDVAPHVPPEVQEERLARFMQKSAGISAARLVAKVGKRMEVLVDGIDGNVAIARSMADAPEIDGVVKIVKGGKLKVGEFADVEIVGSSDHDLEGRSVSNVA